MKFIVIGLGNFGVAIAQKLTTSGNEVIGVDNNMDKVNAYKDQLSHTIKLDATDEMAVSGLPVSETDVIIVAIGKDKGANILVTALFKTIGAKRLVSRVIDPLHQKVLEAIGVHDIVNPEQETAERWAKKLCLDGVVDSFELSDDYSIIQVDVPVHYVGQSVDSTDIREQYDLLVLTTIKKEEKSSLVGGGNTKKVVQGVAGAKLVLSENEIMVLYGANKNLRKFIKDIN